MTAVTTAEIVGMIVGMTAEIAAMIVGTIGITTAIMKKDSATG